MPYLSSVERLACEEGYREGSQIGLKVGIVFRLESKFGAAGTKLLPRSRALHDMAQLRSLARLLGTADRLEAVRGLLCQLRRGYSAACLAFSPERCQRRADDRMRAGRVAAGLNTLHAWAPERARCDSTRAR